VVFGLPFAARLEHTFEDGLSPPGAAAPVHSTGDRLARLLSPVL
jgi:hypothetical protein